LEEQRPCERTPYADTALDVEHYGSSGPGVKALCAVKDKGCLNEYGYIPAIAEMQAPNGKDGVFHHARGFGVGVALSRGGVLLIPRLYLDAASAALL
jgi:hypothetical protein